MGKLTSVALASAGVWGTGADEYPQRIFGVSSL
jgi:hypothetical protein